mgnify:FL=1
MISTPRIAINTEAEIITGLVADALQRGKSFCLWRAPGTTEKFLLITKEVILANEVNLEGDISGFAFAPFHPTNQKVIFPAESLYQFTDGKLTKGELPNPLSSKIQNEKYHFLTATQTNDINYEDLVKLSVAKIE